jgi:hypothetical protein
MKKLLVLALVLSMATLANAALTLTISGPDTLAVGATGTYTVSYSGATILGSDVDIVSDLGTIGGGVAITTNRDAGLDLIGPNPQGGNYEIAVINDVAATDFGAPFQLYSFTLSTTGVAAGSVAHISLIDNAQLDLDWDQIMGGAMGTKAVTIGSTIPEPITMTLLGLGGLFLRRRSK